MYLYLYWLTSPFRAATKPLLSPLQAVNNLLKWRPDSAIREPQRRVIAIEERRQERVALRGHVELHHRLVLVVALVDGLRRLQAEPDASHLPDPHVLGPHVVRRVGDLLQRVECLQDVSPRPKH